MQNARDYLAGIMVPCKLHGTISRTLWLHANCTGQYCEHYGFMQNAWDNLTDIMAPCKLHRTISRTLWLHANCTGQSRRHYDPMQFFLKQSLCLQIPPVIKALRQGGRKVRCNSCDSPIPCLYCQKRCGKHSKSVSCAVDWTNRSLSPHNYSGPCLWNNPMQAERWICHFSCW